MVVKTPRVLSQDTGLRGIRQSIPSGYLLGRKSGGEGPVELLTPADINLIGGGGTAIIGGGGVYTPDFTPSIITTINHRLSREVWLDDLSQPLTTADWGPVITALANQLPKGGRCFLTPGWEYSILTSCTVPPGVTIVGQYDGIGTVTANSQNCDFSNFASVQVAAAATVSLSQSAGFRGCLTYRLGMTFPVSDPTTFAGTAVTGIGDDCFLEDCMILGFAQAFTSTNVNRVHCTEVHFDNTANILIYGSLDTCYIRSCHAWPYLTHTAVDTATRNKRLGTNIGFDACNDWSKVTDCFSYGYAKGFVANNSDSINFVDCGADNVSLAGHGIGFQIAGASGSADNKMIGCQAAANATGFAFTHSSGNTNWMEGCTAWGNVEHGVLVDPSCVGGVRIQGGMIRDNGSDGIAVATAAAVVDIDFVKFNDQTIPINVTVDTYTVYTGDHNDFGNCAAGTSATGVHSVSQAITPSGGVLALPPTGNVFATSGNFADVSGGSKDREVTLLFTGASIVTSTSSATTTKVHLNGNVNTTFANGDTLTLRHFGSIEWYEMARSTAAINAITALTGDVTATGPGSVAATLATINANVGAFLSANITVNAKGLITAAAHSGSVSHTANPGGLIFNVAGTSFYVQWGIVTVATPGTPVSASFLVSFPNALYSLQLTPSTGSASYYPVGAIVTQSTAGFTADSSLTAAFFYMAIGW